MKALLKGYESVIEPIKHCNKALIRKRVVKRLKESNGEGWAVGEMTERACILIDALTVQKSR